TANGQNQLASVRAADGRVPLSTHHSPLTPATVNTRKLVHWYSKRPLMIIRYTHTNVPTDRKKTVLSVFSTASRLFGVRSETWTPNKIVKAIRISAAPIMHRDAS